MVIVPPRTTVPFPHPVIFCIPVPLLRQWQWCKESQRTVSQDCLGYRFLGNLKMVLWFNRSETEATDQQASEYETRNLPGSELGHRTDLEMSLKQLKCQPTKYLRVKPVLMQCLWMGCIKLISMPLQRLCDSMWEKDRDPSPAALSLGYLNVTKRHKDVPITVAKNYFSSFSKAHNLKMELAWGSSRPDLYLTQSLEREAS